MFQQSSSMCLQYMCAMTFAKIWKQFFPKFGQGCRVIRGVDFFGGIWYEQDHGGGEARVLG